jgi:NADH:ubiquinone oxidoreductase subunit 5 (subunit L)/multisubunit Na+/H+ antiporter MnhA subunit
MLVPMAALAVLSAAGGLLGAHVAGEPLMRFLSGILTAGEAEPASAAPGSPTVPGAPAALAASTPEALLIALSVAAALGGIAVGWALHRGRRDPAWARIGAFLQGRWYIDALYDRVIVTPARAVAHWLADPVDLGVIDAFVNGVGLSLTTLSRWARRWQTGYARQYALGVLIGTVVILVYWILW